MPYCTAAGTLLSSASMSAHNVRMEKISRAMVYARAIAAGSASVSSCARVTNTGPMRFTRLLVVAVATISRRRRCRGISRAYRLRIGVGK